MNKLSWTEALSEFLLRLRRLASLNFIFLFVMSGFRLFSHLYYGDPRELAGVGGEVLRAYWIGFRFDLSALAYIAVIPVLIFLVLAIFRKERALRISNSLVKFYYLIFWPLLLICLAVDTGYYSYFQDHINVLIFGFFEDDTVALLKTFWKNYAVIKIILAFSVVLFLSAMVIVKIFKPTAFRQNLIQLPTPFVILGFILPVFLLSLAARGSLGLFPLSVADTVVSSRTFVNHLSYNGFHALIRAIKLRNQQNHFWDANLKYFGYTQIPQAFADYFQIPLEQVPADPLTLLQHRTEKNLWAEKTRPHVLVIMMEGFASSYLKFQSPEFNVMGELQEHFENDLVWMNFLPSHNSTVGSLSSFMISSPQRPNAGFLTETDSMQVPFRSSSARVFKSAGYDTHFLYGGNPGWRDMNKFARFQGFDQIAGEVDIAKKLGSLKETHDWGVYDEDVYEYLWKNLQEATSPQFYLTMTTTNHPPYQTPSNYQPLSLKIPALLSSRLTAGSDLVQHRFQTYQYANQKLAQFLQRLKNSDLAEKVIVAVTGDHGFWMVNFNEQEFLLKWGVPLYLYVPPAIRPAGKAPATFGSHMDIFPTLYSLALSEVDYIGLGSNLLDSAASHFSPHSGLTAISERGGVRVGSGDKFEALDWQNENLIPTASTADHAALAKRYKALMSVMDVYFMEEKKRNQK